MNFALMEMRIVLATLFHHFHISLSEETEGVDPLTFATNRPILKPRDGIFIKVTLRDGIDPENRLSA